MRSIRWLTALFPVPLLAMSLTADQLKINGSITTVDGNVTIAWDDHAEFKGDHASIDRTAGTGELRGGPLGALLSYHLAGHAIQTFFQSARLTINQAMLPITLFSTDPFKITIDTSLELFASHLDFTWDQKHPSELRALTFTNREGELTCSHANFEVTFDQATWDINGSKLTLAKVNAVDTDQKGNSFSCPRLEWDADQRQLHSDGPVCIDHPIWGRLEACGMTFLDITPSPFHFKRAMIHPPLSLSYRGHSIRSESPLQFDVGHRRLMIQKSEGAPAPSFRAEDFTVAANQVEILLSKDFKEISCVTFKEDVIICLDDPQAGIQSVDAHRVEFYPADDCLIATPRSGEPIYFWSADRKSYLTCEKITLKFDPEKNTRSCTLSGHIKALLNKSPPG
jgi:hypothetical protein